MNYDHTKTNVDYLKNGDKKPLRNGLVELPVVESFEVPNFTIPPEPEKDSAFEIALYVKNIGNDDINAVNARELWGKLKVKTDFSDWIKARIAKYDFIQGVDFIAPEKKGAQESMTYGQGKIDYFISLDMARELSMVENNEQGKQARRYFIECEKQAKSVESNFVLGVSILKVPKLLLENSNTLAQIEN